MGYPLTPNTLAAHPDERDTRRHIATRQYPVYGKELLQSACFPPEQLLADSSFIRRGCPIKFTKPATTYEDQADILFERGLALRENSADNSREEIILRLRDVGYYRLSGYWYPFMRDGKFTEGVTFAMIWRRYTFDRQLRFHVLDAIERVEIFLRDSLAMELAQQSGPFGYQYPQNVPDMNDNEHAQFLGKCLKDFHRSKELFATHFKNAYGDSHVFPPIWVIVEMLEFGSLVSLYQGSSRVVRDNIASNLEIPSSILLSWLRTLNDVRNICAHHSRLWNKEFGRVPRIPRDWHSAAFDNRRLFGILTILAHLVTRIAPTSHLFTRFMALLHEYPDLPLCPMGFPPSWKSESCWKHLCDRYEQSTDTVIRSE
ncbi:Abi family protein [Bifidobacterium mongoliense]|uniref:Abi family protein n=2 Tax=Bifidobacterium mongoliense TaxID=518643 RepID=UPI0013773F8F|nr:Abi family protein [Bifidobacterium mongoliense]